MKNVVIYVPTLAYKRIELQYFGLNEEDEDRAGEDLKKLYPEPRERGNIIK